MNICVSMGLIPGLLQRMIFVFLLCGAVELGAVDAPIQGWDKIQLGADYQSVIAVLKSEYPWIGIKTRVDSDIQEENNTRFVEMYPNKYFQAFELQFSDARLYLIRIIFSPRFFTYLTLYETLEKRYGKADEIQFKRVQWKEGSRQLVLERDTTVKYIDTALMTPEETAVEHPADARNEQYVETILEGL